MPLVGRGGRERGIDGRQRGEERGIDGRQAGAGEGVRQTHPKECCLQTIRISFINNMFRVC